MRQTLYRLMGVAALFVLVGCGTNLDKPTGTVSKNAAVVVDVSGDLIKQKLLRAHFPGIDQNSTVYGEKAYRIVYDSIDIHGNPIKASGYMVVPTGLPDAVTRQLGLSIVLDDHGTIFKNTDAPSVMPSQTLLPGNDTSILFSALGGFVTLMPDYVGYGESKGAVHPFVMKRLAEDSAAFLQAARKVAQENGIKLNGQLFVTGYSEGGYAAMATLQKLEDDGESVAMAAPMAGPYDLNFTAFGVLSQPKLSVPSFMAFVGYAYAEAYGVDIATVINSPYATMLPDLFNGEHDRSEIDPKLSYDTTGPTGLFVPAFVADFFANSSNWFRKAVLENSVSAWAAQTPIRLVHCQGDDVIPFAISQATLQSMQSAGTQNIGIIPVEAALQQAGKGDGHLMGHSECGIYAYGIAAELFAQVRQATIGY